MSHQVLYRKYRPMTFDDVVEQQHIVKTLKNTVLSKKAAHAYLFCGTRGTGKTTMAKIFARAVNCLQPAEGNPCNQCEICRGILDNTLMDVYEIDAASNNSVDNVRDIIDEVKYAPVLATCKVYIIDEVHMLSQGAFNALLKTLEEPPEHVLFILATTEPHKLPATVLSRCQRFEFRRISREGMTDRLLLIAQDVGVSLSRETACFIASLAEGALRDGISILDQCIATGEKTLGLKTVHEVVGIASGEFILNTVASLIAKNGKQAMDLIDALFSAGKDPGQFLQKTTQLLRDILIYKTTGSTDLYLGVFEEQYQAIPELSQKISTVELLTGIRELSELEAGIKWSSGPRILLESAFLRICSRETGRDNDTLMERVKLLEERIGQLSRGVKVLPTEDRETLNVKQEDSDYVADTERGSKDGIQNKTGRQEPKIQKETEEAQNFGKGEKAPAVQNHFEEWERVVQQIMSTGRMKLYSSLVQTTAVYINSDTIGIALPEEVEFHKNVLGNSESNAVITEAIKQCTGREVKVRIIHPQKKEEMKTQEEIPDTLLKFVKDKGLTLDIVE